MIRNNDLFIEKKHDYNHRNSSRVQANGVGQP